jgi:hypothetical protein
MPLAFTVAREMPSTHDSEGGSAIGAVAGGGGVGAVGVLLQAAPSASVSAIATPNYTRLHNPHLSEPTILP